LAVSFADAADGALELWLVNNGPAAVEDLAIDLELGRFRGRERDRLRVAGSAAPGAAVLVWSAPARAVPRDAAHYAWASSPAGLFPAARKYFAEIGQLRFGPNSLVVEPVEGGLRIRSVGHSYCVRIDQAEPSVRLSDNCFDLRDGDETTVLVEGADPASLPVSAFPVQRPPQTG
jgi:beta-mannosidase